MSASTEDRLRKEVARLEAVVRAYGLQSARLWTFLHGVIEQADGCAPQIAEQVRHYMMHERLYSDIPSDVM